jgi:transposase
MRYIEDENRRQINLFSKCLDKMIDENNIVRSIDALVETFNIEAMNFV